jgi:hypothetical protein
VIRPGRRNGKKVNPLSLANEAHLTYLTSVLQEIEREDEAWEQSRKTKPKHSQILEEVQSLEKTNREPETAVPPSKEKPKSNGLSGFY